MKALPIDEALAVCEACTQSMATELRLAQEALQSGALAVAVYRVGRAIGCNGLIRTHLQTQLSELSSHAA